MDKNFLFIVWFKKSKKNITTAQNKTPAIWDYNMWKLTRDCLSWIFVDLQSIVTLKYIGFNYIYKYTHTETHKHIYTIYQYNSITLLYTTNLYKINY